MASGLPMTRRLTPLFALAFVLLLLPGPVPAPCRDRLPAAEHPDRRRARGQLEAPLRRPDDERLARRLYGQAARARLEGPGRPAHRRRVGRLRAEEKKLEAGLSTSYLVLQHQRDLAAARTSELRALADYNLSLAKRERALGRTLKTKNILVNE